MIRRCDLLPQYLDHKAEIDTAIDRVLGSGRYTLATEVARFEGEFAEYMGTSHAVGVANATDGLTLSLKALGIGPGDEVITTPFTAIPTCSAIIAAGATPVFTDVKVDTFLMDLDQIPQLTTSNTKAVMPVHIFGNVVDIERLREVVPAHIPIIEDAAQAHGSLLRGNKAGSLGTMGVFSFYPTKNLGGYGDGGMVVTGDPKLAEQLRLLRMYGMTDKDQIIINGVNSRLDELQAAILRVKLPYLDKMNKRRRVIADRYRSELHPDLFIHQLIPDGVVSNYHVLVTRFNGDRQGLIAHLEGAEIQTNIYYSLPLHLQEANRFLGYHRGDLPATEQLCDEVIALPLYPELPEESLNAVIREINTFC